MNTHDFILGPVDTDSISFCKPDFSSFSKQEQDDLLKEINSQFPELIKYDHDGYFRTCVIVGAKNYVMQKQDGTINYKGSALKASMKEEKLKIFILDIINSILTDKNNYVEIYNSYIKEILNVKEIDKWCSRKTITSSVLNPERTNEQKVLDALKDTEYNEGDKVKMFYNSNNDLVLAENFNGDYSKPKLLKKLYDTAMIFETIIDKTLFKNFSLKKHQKELETF